MYRKDIRLFAHSKYPCEESGKNCSSFTNLLLYRTQAHNSKRSQLAFSATTRIITRKSCIDESADACYSAKKPCVFWYLQLARKDLAPMAHTTFEQDMLIAAPCEVVQAHLTHLMTNITEMHPFVVWTRHVKTASAPDGTNIEYYLVHDRMKLGLFTLAFTYKVDMNVSATGRLVSNAYQSPGIHLYNQTWCVASEDGTRVYEHIDITAPRLLLKTTCAGAATAHKEMFARLKTSIEQSSPLPQS